MAGGRPTSRKRILAAAAEVARESGPGNVSLEAVAGRAGVSKGGLLYNFPSKAKLMQALVAEYVEEFEASLIEATRPVGGKKRDSLLAAYIRLSVAECAEAKPSAAWILAAMAEDPDFLAPIKAFRRRLIERLKAETDDAATTLICFLAVEGLRSMRLFEMDDFTTDEHAAVFSSLLATADRLGGG